MNRIILLCIALFIGLSLNPVHATTYTIDNPYITENHKKVTLMWNQRIPVIVTVYKLSYVRKLPNNCIDIHTLGANCAMLYKKMVWKITDISVTDKGYQKGDQYYIQRNIYKNHNVVYGPFIPR